MNRLRAMELFIRLAELGSFTRVADELNSSKSLISKEIGRLEQELGARLLQRSTRRLQLTEIGEGYLERCRKILLQLEDADSYVQDMQGAPRGRLKINAPLALGITDLDRAFSAFMQKYPQIELDIDLNDQSIDLLEQGYDLGLRASSQTLDSNYVGKPITRFSYHVCASPEYLARHPKIKQPQDLQAHNCFIYSHFLRGNHWPLGEQKGDLVEVNGKLKTSNTLFMKQCLLDHHGLAFLPSFTCCDELKDGRFEEVLKNYQHTQLTLYALYPARQFVPPKLKLCVDFLQRWFAEHRRW